MLINPNLKTIWVGPKGPPRFVAREKDLGQGDRIFTNNYVLYSSGLYKRTDASLVIAKKKKLVKLVKVVKVVKVYIFLIPFIVDDLYVLACCNSNINQCKMIYYMAKYIV